MSRIYRVDVVQRVVKEGEADAAERSYDVIERSYLVDTYSPWQAQKHVAKKYINAKVATTHDVAALMAAGAKVEKGAEKPEDPTVAPGVTK